MKIAPLSENNKKSSKLMEHIMVFIVSFVSIYAIVMFVAMRSKSGTLLDGFAKGQWPLIYTGLGIAAVINLFYYLAKKSDMLILSLEFNDKEQALTIEKRGSYSKKALLQTIPYAQLNYSIKDRTAPFLGYKYTVITLYNDKAPAGMVNTSENWDDEVLELRKLVEILKLHKQK